MSSPDERRDREPSINVVDRRALVDRDRRPQLDCESGPPLARARDGGELGRDAEHLVGAIRLHAPVQRDADAGLALDDHAREPGVGLVGRGRDRGRERHDPRVDPAFAVDQELHPVQPGEHETRHRHPPGEELDGPAADDAHPPDPPHEPPERVDRARERDGVVGMIDDRRERAVVVEEDRSVGRPLGERDRSLRRRRSQWDATGMDAKTAARETVETNAQTLIGLSHRVHAHPELKFEETRSSQWTAGVLADAGLTVDAGICDLPDRVLVPDRHRLAAPGDLRGVRRVARASATRAGTTSSPRPRSAPGSRSAPLVDDLDLAHQHHRHAGRRGRRRQGVHAGTRRVRRR